MLRVDESIAKTNGIINQTKIVTAVRMILEAIGEDPDREGLRDTPKRVAKMYSDLFQGLYEDPRDHLTVLFDEQHDEMVLVKDVPFYSMCEHHLLPFHGKAHVAYLPRGKVVGLSKIIRVVEAFARRPQVQERLTSQIADLLIIGEEHHDLAGRAKDMGSAAVMLSLILLLTTWGFIAIQRIVS